MGTFELSQLELKNLFIYAFVFHIVTCLRNAEIFDIVAIHGLRSVTTNFSTLVNHNNVSSQRIEVIDSSKFDIRLNLKS